jgi:phosphatidylserine decarboxylase
MKFARESRPFVLPFLVGAVAAFAWRRPGWGAGALLGGLLTLLFFRDPTRRPAGDEEALLAPADGLITRIDLAGSGSGGTGDAAEPPPPELGAGPYHRIVTFLSVFDVHVQKTPAAGLVVASRHAAGRKMAAFRARAGAENEQHLTVIRRPDGDLVGVAQIAGLLARRVVCYLRAGQQVERGQPMGLIKFGSRVDLYVPASYRLLVTRGEHVRNGATAVALAMAPVAARAPAPRPEAAVADLAGKAG